MMGNTFVDEIENAVLLFSNPIWSGDATIPSTVIKNITALSSELAYSADIEQNITILASKYASTTNGVIQGLLYVPDLDPDDSCKAKESIYIPQSAVRQPDLPPSDYNLIALVPWYDAECTQKYLDSASLDPIRGLITYLPDNSTNAPPSARDRAWSLHDQGAWKENTKFPVYAVSGAIGASMMTQLGLYSGNVSSVPYGSNITALYSPSNDDYVRIWSAIRVATPSTLPTIWIFILVCVGVLLGMVALVSFLMHYVQRRRRFSLERRVKSGEVDLEAMNISRVTVPIHHVEKFPLFTYNYEAKPTSLPPSPITPRTPREAHVRVNSRRIDDFISGESAPPSSEKPLSSPTVARSTVTGLTNASTATDYQPSCTICLEDYQNRSTIIRELSCGHIYHPDCIDEYLSENSSLCPQCKACMLPPGYCPRLTNAMVRRERAVRRLRGQVTDDGELESGTSTWRAQIKKKLFRPSNNASNAVHEVPARHSPTTETRLRMQTLAGGPVQDETSDGRVKRATRAIFPGFR